MDKQALLKRCFPIKKTENEINSGKRRKISGVISEACKAEIKANNVTIYCVVFEHFVSLLIKQLKNNL